MTCNMLCKCPGIYNSDSAAMAISKDDLALIDDYGEMKTTIVKDCSRFQNGDDDNDEGDEFN